jgi:hypothetical protein
MCLKLNAASFLMAPFYCDCTVMYLSVERYLDCFNFSLLFSTCACCSVYVQVQLNDTFLEMSETKGLLHLKGQRLNIQYFHKVKNKCVSFFRGISGHVHLLFYCFWWSNLLLIYFYILLKCDIMIWCVLVNKNYIHDKLHSLHLRVLEFPSQLFLGGGQEWRWYEMLAIIAWIFFPWGIPTYWRTEEICFFLNKFFWLYD